MSVDAKKLGEIIQEMIPGAKPKRKDLAATRLARKRWKGVSKAERKETGKMLASARAAATTPEQRSAIAKKAAAARWAARKSAARKKP